MYDTILHGFLLNPLCDRRLICYQLKARYRAINALNMHDVLLIDISSINSIFIDTITFDRITRTLVYADSFNY